MHQTSHERQAWVDQQQERAVVSEGAIRVEGAGTFAASEYLPEVEEGLTLRSLHRIIRDARMETGRIEGVSVRDLGPSPNWNALAGGTVPEPRHDIAGDPHVTNFLEQRNKEVDKALLEVRALFPGVVREVAEGVKEGIRQGYILSEVAERLPSLGQTKVKIVDTEIIHDEAPVAAADYDVFTDELRVGHSHLPHPRFKVLLKHELTHKLAGGTFGQDAQTGEYHRSRVSFSNMERGNQRIGVMEAVNQHVTMGIETGDFETFDPDKRKDGDKEYYGGRKVVATALERSGGQMAVRTVTRASFEDRTPTSPTTDERREMVTESARAYGPGAWRKIDELTVAAETLDFKAADYQDKLQELTDRIHAPELSDDGTVRKPGSIDVTGLRLKSLK